MIYLDSYYIYQPFDENENVPMYYRTHNQYNLLSKLSLYNYIQNEKKDIGFDIKITNETNNLNENMYNFDDVMDYYDNRKEFKFIGIIDKEINRGKTKRPDEVLDVFKIRENNAVFGKYYFFRKLTYTNGETTGSTEYNPYFTEGINGDISQFPENKNPKSIYKIRLGEDGKFKMENQANQPIPDLSKGFISPNKTDFIYFDPNNGEVALVEDMKPSEEFVAMKPYNVPSKRYIVINNDYQFIIFDNGKQIDTSNMKLAQDMGNLVIQENGVPKYFVPNLDKLTFLKFYPLYILAL